MRTSEVKKDQQRSGVSVTHRMRNALLWLVLLVPLFFSVTLFADSKEGIAYRRTAAVAGSVLSPFCPGRTLQDCPSGPARELKKDIREKFLAGATKEEVFDFLYRTYGDEVRAAPRFSRFGIVAWVTPFVFLLTGGVLLYTWIALQQKIRSNSNNSEELF